MVVRKGNARTATGLATRLGAVLLRPVQFILYWLGGFFPRDRRLWVFGSWSGERMSDSPRALIEYVVRETDDVKAVWITAKSEIRDEMMVRGIDARMRWSPGGIWASLRAGVYLYDGLTRDINHWLSRGAITVQLRHGIGVKEIERGISTRNHRLYKLFHGTALQRSIWSFLLPWHLVRPSLALASSDEDAAKVERFFGIPPDRVAVTGLPRHDSLIVDGLDYLWTDDEIEARDRLENDPKATFLYLPTFRDLKSGFTPSWDQLDKAAADAGVRVYVKLHLVDAQRGLTNQREIEGFQNLRWISSQVDPMALYFHATGIVTDFSSVAFDALLTNKPIIYFVPDMNEYLLGRELFLPFDEVSPGPKPRDYSDLASALGNAADGSIGEWDGQYRKVAARFHKHRDGKNRDRAYRAVRFLTQSDDAPA